MSAYQIVLASASPRRRELLSQIGLTFCVRPSKKEERVESARPEKIVQELSAQKAEDIFAQVSQEAGRHLVIGADTIVVYDGQIMGKPKDEEDACRMLSLLQGKSHQVYTGVTGIWQEDSALQPERFTFYECTDVSFFPMSDAEIAAYVATGEPMDKAGAYGIQGRCAAHIAGIRGDYNNVVGLPVGRLYQQLREKGLL